MAIPKFKNEAVLDFSKPANRKKQLEAIEKVRAEMGKEYPILIGNERITMPQKFNSYNPSKPAEVIGVFQRGDTATANKAMEVAGATFEEWKRVSSNTRQSYCSKPRS